ncbi:hypothetical protein [Curtobacterium sp. 20TX0008]|uniref:hypothetical protein n=1 Tax=Curtobacterium sp. 20TX0008 TaxID=3022018 RepID=UPI00232C3AFA|nr:hypothetical protein [Curtobacterium sp. 20TX0008]MDB6426791.1 hypothetical protein [Curtobacterium sp. 20TX0008]
MALNARRPGIAAAVVATAVVALLSGCAGPPPGAQSDPSTHPDRSETDVQHNGPTPTAMRLEDGVEVWDLTGTPSVEAFGVDTDGESPVRNAVAAYSSTDDRPARFVLPGDRVVDLPVGEVIVTVDDYPDGLTDSSGEVITPAGRSFVLQVEGPTTSGAAAGVAAYRDALESADLPTNGADELQEKVESVPSIDGTETSGRLGASTDVPVPDGMSAALSSRFRPSDTTPTFRMQLFVSWEPVPIP